MHARLHAAISEIAANDWDALHNGRNPFVQHAFLDALEASGSLRADWGWQPHHLALYQDDALIAAAPMYLKANSHGEFVFDHAWAQAYAEHGLDYYPKWLAAAPYSPVTGPRLLACSAEHRHTLAATIAELAARQGISSAHVNFHQASDDAAFGNDWLLREDVQYHWRNSAGWPDFEAFLAAMDHKHRKNIRAERRKLQQAGITFRHLHGDEASAEQLAMMHRFYLRTFDDYGNSPALTLDFIQRIARSLPRNLLLILAEHGGRAIAGALCLRGGDTLYGRYWGSDVQRPGLHFETCYYQGIDYCLREGLTHFEPGAQGEHKIARGFLPEIVQSRHWINDPRFRQPLSAWCAAERASVRRYAEGLRVRSPFKHL
ncbi:MAG: GNAT family N-acetyltransferase [Pseudomonadota bacterium]|nr:GNAT family N-acetyltransferase [Pseudomonadota bacterium]